MHAHDPKTCPTCWSNYRRDTNRPGHRYYISPARPKRRKCWWYMKKPVGPKPGAPAESMVLDDLVAKRWPHLGEYLAESAYEDGSPRVTSTLLVFAEDGWWKGCLKDRDNERSLWHSNDTLESLLDGLEELLATGRAEWRASPNQQQKRGR